MIKANELRIGNILIDVEDRICKVERIYEDDWTAYAIKGVTTTGTPYPIQLTEEILLKVGFVRTKVPMKSDIEYIDYRMGQFVLFILPKGIVEVEFCAAHNKIEERGYLRAVKHLHQLQNLYFALTGQELDVSKLI